MKINKSSSYVITFHFYHATKTLIVKALNTLRHKIQELAMLCFKITHQISANKKNLVSLPIETSETTKKTDALATPQLLPKITFPVRKGIRNLGHTCYLSALMQSLASVCGNFRTNSSTGEAAHTYMAAIVDKNRDTPLAPYHTKQFFLALQKEGWETPLDSDGDPNELLQLLQPHIEPHPSWIHLNKKNGSQYESPAALECCIENAFSPGISTQDLVDRKESKTRILVSARNQPQFFSLLIDRRKRSSSQRKTNTIQISPIIRVPCDDGTVKTYHLASVIAFDNHQCDHYISFEPKFNSNNAISEWTTFNDSASTTCHDPKPINDFISTNGYLFFYKHTSPANCSSPL